MSNRLHNLAPNVTLTCFLSTKEHMQPFIRQEEPQSSLRHNLLMNTLVPMEQKSSTHMSMYVQSKWCIACYQCSLYISNASA